MQLCDYIFKPLDLSGWLEWLGHDLILLVTGQARTSLRLKTAEDLGRYLTTKIAEGP